MSDKLRGVGVPPAVNGSDQVPLRSPSVSDDFEALRKAAALPGLLAEEDCIYAANTYRGMVERGTLPKYTTVTVTISPIVSCAQAFVKIQYMPSEQINSDKSKELTFTILHQLAGKIMIEVRPRDKSVEILRLTIQLSEGAEFFAGGYPTTETYEAFCRKVRERKAYPPAKVPIPCEGGKSPTAQGQTKKPESHSQDKHK